MEPVGTIASIARYPVKSMAGETLQEAPVTLQGILGDRWYAYVQAGDESLFPWLTGRQYASLLTYTARLEPGQPPKVLVRTPAGQEFTPTDPALLSELAANAGRAVHPLPNYRGSFDVAPITLIGLPTLTAIGEASGTAIEPRRLRMNFHVDWDRPAFAEDAWVGRTLRIGEHVRVAVNERDKRCVMTTLDPEGGQSAPGVLRAIAQLNEAFAGVYAAVLTAGMVKVGDPVLLED
jgi:uncharacterized protein YcbX